MGGVVVVAVIGRAVVGVVVVAVIGRAVVGRAVVGVVVIAVVGRAVSEVPVFIVGRGVMVGGSVLTVIHAIRIQHAVPQMLRAAMRCKTVLTLGAVDRMVIAMIATAAITVKYRRVAITGVGALCVHIDQLREGTL
ncbi:hypothetical protein A5640_02925 [Mycobacterium asiaticum]|uniref:Uncharacterized protein n=1 Tax=Mycobacterium asiaticum TaxID=1790 RepID=A0A1A3KYM7_MYCAS|nr:hypothetical protein A5640_02925 [Mycobacterium asiaticum]